MFVANKLNIHFGEDKTKSKSMSMYIKYQDDEIKQYSQVTYLSCVMNEAVWRTYGFKSHKQNNWKRGVSLQEK